MKFFLLVSLVALSFSGNGLAEQAQPEWIFDDPPPHRHPHPYWRHSRKTVCVAGEHVRMVEVYYPRHFNRLPCQVRYHKPTELPDQDYKVLWWANHTKGFCARKARLLVSRLEGWGWQCWKKRHRRPDRK